MSTTQAMKNGAGVGYMQSALNTVLDLDLTIDGLLGPKTFKALCDVMFLGENWTCQDINVTAGIEIFQHMYMRGWRDQEQHHHLVVDGKWGKDTKITFDMIIDYYVRSTVIDNPAIVRKPGDGLRHMLAKMQSMYNNPSQDTVKEHLTLKGRDVVEAASRHPAMGGSNAEELVEHYREHNQCTLDPESVNTPYWRLVTSTPPMFGHRYESLLDRAIGDTGNSVEGLLTTGTYCMFYVSDNLTMPLGVIVFRRDENNGRVIIVVENSFHPSSESFFESYDSGVAKILNMGKKWGCIQYNWNGLDATDPSPRMKELISSLKAYGFVTMFDTSMYYMPNPNS